EAQSPRGAGGLTTIDVTLGGLPTTGPGRWIAIALAIVMLGAGLSYWAQSASNGSIVDDARRDLIQAREALLGESLPLERAFKQGEIGPKTYARVRASLLDALARIVAMVGDPPAKTKTPPDRSARSSAKPSDRDGGSSPKAGRRMEPST